jgi:hypothetical protein
VVVPWVAQVNRELAEKLLRKDKSETATAAMDPKNPLGDDRFSRLFTSEDYQVRAIPAFDLAILRALHHSKGPKGLGSAGRGGLLGHISCHLHLIQVNEESEEFKLRNPSGMGTSWKRSRGDGSDDELLLEEAFEEVEGSEDEDDNDDDDDDGSSDGEESSENEVDYKPESLRATKPAAAGSSKAAAKGPHRKPRFLEMQDPDNGRAPVMFHDGSRKERALERIEARRVPLAERVKGQDQEARPSKKGRLIFGKDGTMREFSYVPGGAQRTGRGGGGRGGGRGATDSERGGGGMSRGGGRGRGRGRGMSRGGGRGRGRGGRGGRGGSRGRGGGSRHKR